MNKIIIINQQKDISKILDLSLENTFFDINAYQDLEVVPMLLEKQSIDLMIIDQSCIGEWQRIEKYLNGSKIPILLIAKNNHLDKLLKRDIISDVICVPFNKEELTYRVKKLINFEQNEVEDSNKIIIADLIIDLEKYTVSVDQKIIDLTFKEFELLAYLAHNIDTPFTRDSLLDKVWGYDYIGGYRTVDVHVRRIRSKIERNFQYIQTVRNIGYRFINPKKNN